jgi:hypothetical protein
MSNKELEIMNFSHFFSSYDIDYESLGLYVLGAKDGISCVSPQLCLEQPMLSGSISASDGESLKKNIQAKEK